MVLLEYKIVLNACRCLERINLSCILLFHVDSMNLSYLVIDYGVKCVEKYRMYHRYSLVGILGLCETIALIDSINISFRIMDYLSLSQHIIIKAVNRSKMCQK